MIQDLWQAEIILCFLTVSTKSVILCFSNSQTTQYTPNIIEYKNCENCLGYAKHWQGFDAGCPSQFQIYARGGPVFFATLSGSERSDTPLPCPQRGPACPVRHGRVLPNLICSPHNLCPAEEPSASLCLLLMSVNTLYGHSCVSDWRLLQMLTV